MDFSEALRELKYGAHMTREDWQGRSMWVKLHYPTPTSSVDRPFLLLSDSVGRLVPWTPSQIDLLAEDWEFH